jgi:hypothetical protein
MPVIMVRNNQAGPTVLSSDPKGSEMVEWQGKGDPAGGDIQPVPQIIQDAVAFQRCVRRGIFTLLDDADQPVIDEAMSRQQQHWDKRQAFSADTAAEVINHEANKDIITLLCVGPSSRGEGRCGADVAVRDATKNDKVPLCSMHENLAAQYIPSEEMVNGKNVTVWTRTTMGARERQQN